MNQGDIAYTSTRPLQFFTATGEPYKVKEPVLNAEFEVLAVDSDGNPTHYREWDGTVRTPTDTAIEFSKIAGTELIRGLDSNMTIMFNNGTSGETDYSGNGNAATHNGSSTATAQGTLGNLTTFTFNGTDDYFSVSDADNLSFGDGTTDQPFWIFTIFKPPPIGDTSARVLASKWDESTGSQAREWLLQTDVLGGNRRFRLALFDESEASANQADAVGAFGASDDWASLFVYYDGRGGANAADGMRMAYNGVEFALTAGSASNYTAMENLGAPVLLSGRESSGGTIERFWSAGLGMAAIGSNTLSDFAATAEEVHRKIAQNLYLIS